MIGLVEPALQRIDLDDQWLPLPEHHGVVAVAVVVVRPDRAVREDGEKGRDFAAHDRAVRLVERHPLRHQPAGLEPLFAQLEILLRIQHGRAFDPRMDRV